MTRIRLMTANLWAEHIDPERFAALLDRIDPDVLAVQELQEPAAAVIRSRFDHVGLAPSDDTMGNGIATRFPAAISRLHLTGRSGWTARIAPNPRDPNGWPELARAFDVLTVHLANPIGWPWLRSAKVRTRQSDAVIDHVRQSGLPSVVCGDFNAPPGWPMYRKLRNTFADGALDAATAAPTWRFVGKGPRLLRIDHILTTDITTISTEPVDVPGSDHLALVAELEV